MFPIPYILLGVVLLLPLSFLSAKTYIWTDTNGQQIEAEFVRCSADTLTISMQGQELVLPISSLSAFSKALAIKLRSESAPAKPANLHTWKDLQGRVIQAEFLEASSSTVKLLWNGQPFELPIPTLSQESKNLVRKLSGGTSAANPSTPPLVKPASPSSPPKGTDPNGPLDLSVDQTWLSADGRTLKAKFINFESDELTLLTSSDQEIEIHIDNLSEQAVMLARKLQALNEEKKKKALAFAQSRKKMKVPEVSNEDLEKVHQLKNTEGVSISATFIDADDLGVAITLAGKTQPLELSWDRFSKESQALLEALRRKSLTANRTPGSIPAKGSKIAYFSSGPFKGYNSVVQTERFDVALSSSGRSTKIWLKDPKNPSTTPKTFGLVFDATYTDKTTNPEKPRNRQRSITGFNSPPQPSLNRENVTLSGSLKNGGSFQYEMELNSKGLLFWGKVSDPPGEKEPTRLSIYFSIPGIVPDSKNKTMAQIMPIIGDASLTLEPGSGKRRIYPFKEKWIIMNQKYKGEKFGGLKAATVMGFPYGPNKLTVTPLNGSGMSFSHSVSYGKIFPFQGLSLDYRNATQSKEIPKNRALKVLLTGV
jgi:hypothetical protein